MSAPPSFSSRTFVRAPSTDGGGESGVFAVGSHVLIAAQRESVPLLSDDGTTVLTTLANGIKVEIVAWRPRRSGGALYRVRSAAANAVEGWIPAACLKALAPPPVRKVARPSAPPTRLVPARTAGKGSASKPATGKAPLSKAPLSKPTLSKAPVSKPAMGKVPESRASVSKAAVSKPLLARPTLSKQPPSSATKPRAKGKTAKTAR